MLKQVQHNKMVGFQSCCHPEPGPEASSGSSDFGISILGLEIWVLKPRPVGGVLYFKSLYARRFWLNDMGRDDIGALTHEASKVSRIPGVWGND
jgi:hypothetical protein